MKKYKISWIEEVYCEVVVEAKNEEDAWEKLEEVLDSDIEKEVVTSDHSEIEEVQDEDD